MEPLGTTTSSPETPIPVDPGLQDAAQGLADRLDSQPPASASGAPAEATPGPAGQAPSAESSRSGFREGHQKFMTGYRGRMQRIRDDNRRFQEERQRYDQARARDNELLQAAVEAMKARGSVEAEEKVPDPVLDPQGFHQWLLQKQSGGMQEVIKPVLEAVQRQEQRFAQLEQTRAQQAEQQERQQAAVRQFETWEQEYQRESPELAVGVRERYTLGRDLLSRSLAFAGVEPEVTQGLAERILFGIAAGADASGDNGVAAIDGWVYGLYREFWELFRADLALDGLQVPAFDGASGAAAPATTSGAPAAAQRTETARLQAVQQRTAAVANAAPRVAARATSGGSELETLWRNGERNVKQLRAAALRETGGDMRKAQELLGSLAAQIQ